MLLSTSLLLSYQEKTVCSTELEEQTTVQRRGLVWICISCSYLARIYDVLSLIYSHFCSIPWAQRGKEEGQDSSLLHAVWCSGGFLCQLKIQLCLEILCYFKQLQAPFATSRQYKDMFRAKNQDHGCFTPVVAVHECEKMFQTTELLYLIFHSLCLKIAKQTDWCFQHLWQ